MDIIGFITREIVPISGFVILFLTLFTNNKINKENKKCFYYIILTAVLEIIAYEAELITSSFDKPTNIRILLSVIGYTIRPLMIYLLIEVFTKKTKSWFNRIILVCPIIIVLLVTSTAFFSDICFSYDENNVFHSTPILGRVPHLVGLLYLLTFAFVVFKNVKANHKFDKVIAYGISFFAILAIVINLIGNVNEIVRIMFLLCILLSYIWFQNNAFYALIDEVPTGLAIYKIVNNKCAMISYNDTLCNMLGVKRNEYEKILKDDFFCVLSDGFKKEALESIERIINGEDIVELQFSYNIDGHEKWYNVVWRVFSRINDEITVCGAMMDITKEKTMEENYKIKEKEVYLSMSQLGKIVCLYDVANRTLTMPEEYAKSHGFEKTTIVIPDDVYMMNIVNDDSSSIYNEFYERILKGEKKGTAVCRLKNKDEEYFYEKAEFVTIFDSKGNPCRAIVFVENVTKEYEEKAALERYKAKLDRLVGDKKQYMQYDLRERRIIDCDGGLFSMPDDLSSKTLEDVLEYHLNNYIKEGDKDIISEFMNSKSLIESYNKGVYHLFVEREAILPNKDNRWIRLSIDLDKISDNIIATFLWEDVDDEHHEYELIVNRANYDALTGLLNRSSTIKEIENYICGIGKDGTHALIMMDMDNLKGVNDTLGHQYGDAALQRFAYEVKRFFRKDDIIGRIGGDEFFIFLKNITIDLVSRKMRALLQTLEIVYQDKDKKITTSASAGISLYHGFSSVKKSLNELYKEADSALYKAKSNGKHTYSYFDNLDILADANAVSEVIKTNDKVSFSLHELFNRIVVGISIYHGSSLENIEPIFCNDTFLAMTGLTRDEFINKMNAKNGYGIHPDDKERVTNEIYTSLKTGSTIELTFRLRKSETEYIKVKCYSCVYMFDDGSFDFYFNYINNN